MLGAHNRLGRTLRAPQLSRCVKDTTVFDSYVSKGWCFVVAIINPSRGEEEHMIVSEGLAAPLILRFPHTTPIYPLALTGTGGFDTEILVYLASSEKMTAHDRLTLRFAGEMEDMYERSSTLLKALIASTTRSHP
jgi:hypothetical protein